MTGRAFRRVPVSASTFLPLISYAALLCGVGLIVLLTAASAGPAAAELASWRAQVAPTLALDALDGGRIDLADLDDGVVVVHFFATWCEPCRDELSALEQMMQGFEGRPLAVLAVDSGEPEARVRRFFREFPVSFPILLDGDRAALKTWDVTTFPTSFIVGGSRQPLMIAEGEVAWDSNTIAAAIATLLDTGDGPRARAPTGLENPHVSEGEAQ
jgi:peroxiredoxin